MFTLFRTRLMKRLAVGFAGVLLLAVGVFFAIKQNKIEDTNAATADNTTVSVGSNGTAHYGEDSTGYYDINSGGQLFTAFCAEPKMYYPAVGAWEGGPARRDITARYASDNTKNNKIKMMIYLLQNRNNETAKAALNVVFQDWNWENMPYEQLYGWTHAIIGYIYTDGTDAPSTGVSWVQTASQKLGELIPNNAAWAAAQHYRLYIGEGKDLDDGYGKRQDVVWIEPVFGDIKVQKLDNDTNTATPQGNASLGGIHFEVVRTSDNKVVASGLTENDGTVTFAGLPVGVNYFVREAISEDTTNTSYTIENKETTAINLTTSGYTFEVKDSVKRGDVTLDKVDKETQSCDNKTSELSFNGTKFQIINDSQNAIVIGGTTYANGAVIETKTFSADTCNVKFENLPFGNYIIQETDAATGYERNTEDIEVIIPTNNSYSVSKKAEEQPIRGDVRFVKMDNNNGIPMDNTLFSISALDKNNNVKETHLVVSNQDGVVDTSSSFIRHSIHTNGYDALYDAEAPIVFQGYGTWFGIDSNSQPLTVNDSLGALPYGTYIIQELKCDANFFCSNIINQKKTIVIDEPNEVVDLGNWDNTCAEFTLSTTASDAKDGDEIVEDGGEVTIKDEVNYCVKAGMDFTIKGILMDKSTGEPLLVNGKTVENQVALNSETDCGAIDMFFTFDSTGLGGKDLVVFEKLYYGEDLLTSHEDLDDEKQTMHVFKLTTFARNKATGEKVLPLDQDVVIEDLVQYCVTPGLKYKISGVLMDKRTGNGVLVNSEPVEQSVIIEPEEACGELVMEYPINTTGLGGADLVFFETLYSYDEGDPEDEDDDVETEIIVHNNLDNESETVHVEPPAPDTGYITKANDEGSSTNYTFIFTAGLITLGLGGYAAVRSSAKRRVMKF